VKTLQTPRLVRILFGGEYIVQTTSALFVWEHPYYPQYYVPKSALLDSKAPNLTVTQDEPIKDPSGTVIAHRHTLSVSSKQTNECIIFASDLSGPASHLANLARISFGAMDRWFEEATPIYVHPKDPFKRVDVLPSTRHIQVSINGVQVADSRSSMHLYETGLPARFYLPLTDVDVSLLRPSETKTQCPYKGEAEYYSVDTGKGGLAKDVVWFYERPVLECAKIEGEFSLWPRSEERVYDLDVGRSTNTYIVLQDFSASTTKKSTSRLTESGWRNKSRRSADRGTSSDQCGTVLNRRRQYQEC
jgi:uncharacterized protein (DUF427 family)